MTGIVKTVCQNGSGRTNFIAQNKQFRLRFRKNRWQDTKSFCAPYTFNLFHSLGLQKYKKVQESQEGTEEFCYGSLPSIYFLLDI